MKVIGLLTLTAMVLSLTCPTSVNSQVIDPDLSDKQAQLLTTLGVSEVALVGNLINLNVSLENAQAGVISAYRIDFEVDQNVYDLLKNGGLKYAFPEGFDLTCVESIDIEDDLEPLELEVEGINVSGQLLTIHLQQDRQDDYVFTLSDDLIDVSVYINYIGNPQLADEYQLAALAFKQNNAIIAGPTFSNLFTIIPNAMATIEVTPSGDVTLRAGDTQQFSASGFDEFGNKLQGVVFLWSLDCNNCIGFMTGSTLNATTPGQARVIAQSGYVTGESGIITVLPGDLARMDLVISDTQFVGNPLRGSGDISLYDGYDNLKTDYSLSHRPVTLIPTVGAFDPDMLADDTLLDEGVIRLLPAGVTFFGSPGNESVFADNTQVVSNSVPVSFNGYELLEVLDNHWQPLTTLFFDSRNSGIAVVRLDGNFRPTGASLSSGLKSDNFFHEYYLEPGALGVTDTVFLDLRHLNPIQEEDTLIVRLKADYEIDGGLVTTLDSLVIPVIVLPAAHFSVLDGSVSPDSAVVGSSLPISFDMTSNGFTGAVDSARVSVDLYDAVSSGSPTPHELFEGAGVPVDNGDGTFTFTDLAGFLPDDLGIGTGWYPLIIDGVVFTSGGDFVLSGLFADSLFVITPINLTVDPTTVSPSTVSAGSTVPFQFVLNSGSDFPLGFVSEASSFTVTGTGFSTTTTLSPSRASILPGDNLLVSEGIFIPQSQLDSELSISADIGYTIPGVSGIQIYSTDFGQMLIPVTALPVIQILQVDAVAPNIPKVNTDQQFQISAVVTNLSATPVSGLGLTLSSDGASVFDTSPLLVDLGANDTVEVFWDVVAASQPNSAEIFIVDVDQSGVAHLLPLDNVTLVTIETPADLELTYSLFGVENGMIDYGNDFNLTVELMNYGMAEVSDAGYMLVAEGFDADGPDTLAGFISVGRHIEFSFVAPQHDTTLDLSFSLIGAPIDLNAAQPASIGDTAFSLSITVISAEASLFIEITPLGTNLVLPGRQKELDQFDLTNTGISSAARMQLDRLQLLVRDGSGNPVDAMSVFNIGSTGFYENGQLVSVLTAGDSLLLFSFDQFIIDPLQTRTLVLKAEFKQSSVSSVVLLMAGEGVIAHFVEGPNAGLAPSISSDADEGEPLLSQSLALKSASLEGSFILETNPFNPEDPAVSPVHLSYELDEDAAVEFRIFTLTGEEVYERDYAAGSVGGSSGENVIEWDGRNNDGLIVLNGVYVAVIHNSDTAELARLKIAVVKL